MPTPGHWHRQWHGRNARRVTTMKSLPSRLHPRRLWHRNSIELYRKHSKRTWRRIFFPEKSEYYGTTQDCQFHRDGQESFRPGVLPAGKTTHYGSIQTATTELIREDAKVHPFCTFCVNANSCIHGIGTGWLDWRGHFTDWKSTVRLW